MYLLLTLKTKVRGGGGKIGCDGHAGFFYEGGRRVTCLTQVSGTSTQPATRHDSLHKAIRGQSFSHGCGWRLLVSRHKDDGVARSDSTPSFTNRRYKVPPDGRSLVAAKGKMPSPRVPMKVLLDFFTPSHSPPSPTRRPRGG